MSCHLNECAGTHQSVVNISYKWSTQRVKMPRKLFDDRTTSGLETTQAPQPNDNSMEHGHMQNNAFFRCVQVLLSLFVRSVGHQQACSIDSGDLSFIVRTFFIPFSRSSGSSKLVQTMALYILQNLRHDQSAELFHSTTRPHLTAGNASQMSHA